MLRVSALGSCTPGAATPQKRFKTVPPHRIDSPLATSSSRIQQTLSAEASTIPSLARFLDAAGTSNRKAGYHKSRALTAGFLVRTRAPPAVV